MGSCLSTCACGDGKQTADFRGFGSNRWKSPNKNTRSRGLDGGASHSLDSVGAFDFGRLAKSVGLGEDELQRIPGRMFVNGASTVACLYTQQGRKGTNQDAMLVWEFEMQNWNEYATERMFDCVL
ncbi:hypothetical protein ACLOJK_041549 [Asimina triloba]